MSWVLLNMELWRFECWGGMSILETAKPQTVSKVQNSYSFLQLLFYLKLKTERLKTAQQIRKKFSFRGLSFCLKPETSRHGLNWISNTKNRFNIGWKPKTATHPQTQPGNSKPQEAQSRSQKWSNPQNWNFQCSHQVILISFSNSGRAVARTTTVTNELK